MTTTRKRALCAFSFLPVAATVLAASVCLRAGVVGDGNPTPAKPHPPALKKTRLQYLTKHYQDAFVDGSGRMWFLFRLHSLSDTGRNTTFERLVCPDLPKTILEVPALSRIIGFDSKDRLWEATKYGLGCTDVKTGKFQQRRVAPRVDKKLLPKPNKRHGPFTPSFAPVMLEHSSGRLYFMDCYGAHVLDGKTWSYHLYDPPTERLARPKNWDSFFIKIVEGPDGRVFLWGKSYLMKGCWTHDGKRWKHHTSLAAAKPAPKWSAFRYIAAGPNGDTFVEGRKGRNPYLAFVRTDGSVVKAPKGLVLRKDCDYRSFRLAVLADGRMVLPTKPLYTWGRKGFSPLFKEPMAVTGQFLGVDKHGRVAIDTDGQEIFSGYTRLAVYDLKMPGPPPSLKCRAFPAVSAAAVDSAGRVWARFCDGEGPFLSLFVGGAWKHYPAPDGPAGAAGKPDRGRPRRSELTQLQPLRDRCTIASENNQGRAFFFDGEAWTGYESLQRLVEKNYTRLKQTIDNAATGWKADGNRVGVDAGGRIWVCCNAGMHPKAKTSRSRVYDGGSWNDGGEPFLLGPSGRLCIRGHAIYDARSWPPKKLSALPGRDYARRVFYRDGWAKAVHFDRAGRFWTFGDFNGPAYRYENDRFVKISVRGRCVLQDSAGRMWFNGGFSLLTVLDANGGKSKSYEHPVRIRTPVVQQGENSFWCAASDGVMHLTITGRGSRMRIVVKKHYLDLVPQGYISQVFLDGENGMWIRTTSYNCLCRVSLPPAPHAGNKGNQP